MPLKFLDESGFSLGMIRDVPSWQIPKGGVYDSLNMLYDKPGVARMRCGTVQLTASTQAGFMTSIGWVYSQDTTPIEELYGLDGKTGTLYSINKSTGATTSVGTPVPTNSTVGRPVRHFGFLVFPGGFASSAILAGQTSSTTFTNTAASTITANDPQITLGGADTTTNVKVGGYVNANTATVGFDARVVSIDSATKFSVWPVPPIAAAPAAGGLKVFPVNASSNVGGGVCAASFQNRLLFGNTFNIGAYQATTSTSRSDRRVNYGLLPTESVQVGAQTYYGAAGFLSSTAWPALNYFEAPGSDPIVAMEPVSDNQLLILTSTHPVVFSGNLTTQLATTSPTITFDINEVPGNASCVSDLSVQRTSKGVVWAGSGGIYAWNGREPVDLTDKKINTYWRGLVRGSSFALHGSAYVRGHYFVFGSSGGSLFGLACNLANLAWTRIDNFDIFLGAPRPTDPSSVFAARWWDQTGAAPNFQHGQTCRLETMFDPHVTGAGDSLDSDGATFITTSITTRVITGDPETQKIQQRCTVRYQADALGSGSFPTVTAQSKIDASDISADSVRTLGVLSSTIVHTITNATNATPIVVTTSSVHGLNDSDFVDINGVAGNLNANGRWRMLVTAPTTFLLVGSTGSGAYTSGGSVKKLTETDLQSSSLDAGQGVSFKISTTSTYNWEFHGVRIAFFEKQPVMSA